jgi:dTDP-4-amino-4,6-dideoxygalactose transaminase
MWVPLLDIAAENRALRDEILEAMQAVIAEAQFILGPAVERFEEAFARYLGVPHCVAVNSGTSALHLALLACGVGPGDEVVTTPHTWVSTAWAIRYVGACPVFADIDPVTYTLDPEAARRAVTPRTRALLPVHLYGQAADLAALRRVADDHGLALIEDAAQAHGARFAGRRVGGLGTLGCFSFYPSKNLGCFGEGGAVVTADDGLARRLRRLRDHAQEERNCHVELGFNMRMEGIQGAVLNVKLGHLDARNAARARHAAEYGRLLADVPGLTLPAAPRPEGHVWHRYVVLVHGHGRDALRAALLRRGVETGVQYPTPVPYQPAFARHGFRPGDFPVAEEVTGRCLSLPLFPELTPEQLAHACKNLRDLLARPSGGSL